MSLDWPAAKAGYSGAQQETFVSFGVGNKPFVLGSLVLQLPQHLVAGKPVPFHRRGQLREAGNSCGGFALEKEDREILPHHSSFLVAWQAPASLARWGPSSMVGFGGLRTTWCTAPSTRPMSLTWPRHTSAGLTSAVCGAPVNVGPRLLLHLTRSWETHGTFLQSAIKRKNTQTKRTAWLSVHTY